jgi:geranylgeranyl pyrophosphate synthase
LTVKDHEKLIEKSELINKILQGIDLSNIHSIIRGSTQYTISSGGQRLRPLICMLCAEVVGGNYKDTKDTFLALELIHNATLVHDDILDEDQYRRGSLSVPEKFGTKKAVLTGDTLFALGLMYAAKTGNPEVINQLSETTLKMIQGISLQSTNKCKLITENELLHLNYLKSGSLFQAAAVLGGIIGDSSPEELGKLAEFGRFFGNAYQIRDDICDAFLENGIDSKARNDILNGDTSLLLIYSIESNNISENDKDLLLTIYKGNLKEFNLEKLRRVYENSNALERSINKMKEFSLKARQALEYFGDSEAKSNLNNILDRYYLRFEPHELERDLI